VTQFRLFLLRAPRLEQDDQPLKVKRRKALALLAEALELVEQTQERYFEVALYA
jgi:hypothetical protein